MMAVGNGTRGSQDQGQNIDRSSSGGEDDVSDRHIPVLLNEVVEAISPKEGGVYLDATFGAGGYSSAILATENTTILGIDRDPDVIRDAAALQQNFADRLKLLHGPFSQMQNLAQTVGVTTLDGVMLDLGVSSMQLDQAERGFSFMKDGPLDMRMAQEGLSAEDVVNKFEQDDIANILYLLGEERKSRVIAKAIVNERKEEPITTTIRLAQIIEAVLGRKHDQKTHPATRSFQALRLYVNGELEQLVEGLMAAERLLSPNGTLAVVTFHSLEDRIVKRFFQDRSGNNARPSRHMPDASDGGPEPSFTIPHRKPIAPSKEETDRNPRARSAKLRVGLRTDAPPMPDNRTNLGLIKLP